MAYVDWGNVPPLVWQSDRIFLFFNFGTPSIGHKKKKKQIISVLGSWLEKWWPSG